MNNRTCVCAVVGFAVISVVLGCKKKPEASTAPNPTPSMPTPTPNGTPLAPSNDKKGAEGMKTSRDNMRKIATAMVEDRSPNDAIHAGIYAADGRKVGLSWRVAILPGLKEDALYKEFKLDEPWDSEHNKKLIAKMPKIFAASGKDSTEGKTYYRSFVGKDTVMPPPPPGKAGQPVPGIAWPLGIPDGTSNTVLFVEAAEPVIWTKPEELEYDPRKPLPKLGVNADGYFIVFADSDARFYRRGSLTDDTLRAIITPAGGELFTLPDDKLPSGPSGATKR